MSEAKMALQSPGVLHEDATKRISSSTLLPFFHNAWSTAYWTRGARLGVMTSVWLSHEPRVHWTVGEAKDRVVGICSAALVTPVVATGG